MCYLCEEYGDPAVGGGLWYFNPKNYARNMYKLRLPGEGFKGARIRTETEEQAGGGPDAGPINSALVEAAVKGQREEFYRIRQEIEDTNRERGVACQVVPLKDAEALLDLCSPIGLMSCACRKGLRARDERNEAEYTCIGPGVGMLKWERWPERYKGGVKFVNPEEAKEFTRKMNRRGFVHVTMLAGAGYITGLCACDYPDCGLVRQAVDFSYGLIKSHYVAAVDYDICNGCGICIQRCQFGALKFEATTEKANIDQFKCFGCGLCETGCPRGAIELVERKSLPALAEVWT